jgi:hypothetical protein
MVTLRICPCSRSRFTRHKPAFSDNMLNPCGWMTASHDLTISLGHYQRSRPDLISMSGAEVLACRAPSAHSLSSIRYGSVLWSLANDSFVRRCSQPDIGINPFFSSISRNGLVLHLMVRLACRFLHWRYGDCLRSCSDLFISL